MHPKTSTKMTVNVYKLSSSYSIFLDLDCYALQDMSLMSRLRKSLLDFGLYNAWDTHKRK